VSAEVLRAAELARLRASREATARLIGADSPSEIAARQCRSLEDWQREVDGLASARGDEESRAFARAQRAVIRERQAELRCTP
jgi:hypothetical protein